MGSDGADKWARTHSIRTLFFLAAVTASLLFGQAQSTSAGVVACTTSWNDAGGGNWTDAGKWSGGLPDSNDDVCITLDGTYTVLLSASSATVNSITIGGTSGTQTLTIQSVDVGAGAFNATLTINNGGANLVNGRIHLTHQGPFPNPVTTLNVAGGTLTNAGTIQVPAGDSGNSRIIQGNISSTGTIDIDRTTTYSGSGTLTNGGPMTIANTTELSIPQAASATFTNATNGSITADGNGQVFMNRSEQHLQSGRRDHEWDAPGRRPKRNP